MPIYEYQCTKCGATADIKHGFKEPMTQTCGQCGGDLKRLFNAASIVFKGSGFYVNDSRKASSSSSNAASSASPSASPEGSAKTESSKSEGAPASGSGPKSDAAA